MQNLVPNAEKSTQNHIWRLLVLISATLFIFGKSTTFDFIPTWDDDNYLLKNYVVHSWSVENLSIIFSSTFCGNYAPLHILTYAIEHSLWGMHPAGYHLSNVVIHALNACLAYIIIVHISRDGFIAFSAALLFALHPVNVENVAWVSESKTILAAFWAFSAVLLYVKFRAERKYPLYYLAMACFIAGMLTKASVVTLPLIFLAYEWYLAPSQRNVSILVPLFILSLVGGSLAVWAQTHDNAIPRDAFALESLWNTVYPTMLPVMWKYLGLLIWPVNLCGFYDTSLHRSFFDIPVLTSLAAWLVVFIVIFTKASPGIRFWFCWYWAFLLPASNLVPLPVYYADRYLYLSSIGMFALAIMAIQALTKKMARGNKTAIGVVTIAAVFYAIAAFDRINVWRNETVFWEDTVKKSPQLYNPNLKLAVAYDKAGRYDDAERFYRAALAIQPGGEEARYNLQMIHFKKEYRKQRDIR